MLIKPSKKIELDINTQVASHSHVTNWLATNQI